MGFNDLLKSSKKNLTELFGSSKKAAPADTDLEKRVAVLESQRRKRDKALKWESSIQRRLAIFLSIYVFTLIYLLLISSEKPFLGALVPAIGYLLTTLSLHFERKRRARKAAKQ